MAPRDCRSASAAAFTQRNGPNEIRREYGVPKIFRESVQVAAGDRRFCARNAGIVDEVIKTAERLNDLLHHRLGFARLGNVAGRTSDVDTFLV